MALYRIYAVQTFKGVGHTKKRAKQSAAQSALHSCVQFRHPQHVQTNASDDERRRRGVMAMEDFTADDVDDGKLHLNFNCLNKSATLSRPEEWGKKCHSANHRLSFWTRHFGSGCLEDGFDQLFNHIEGSTTSGFSDDENDERRSRYLSGAHRLNTGLVEDWSAPSAMYEISPDRRPSSTSMRRRWWNPVAVLSDLRPNIQYHKNAASDTSDEDERPDRRTINRRRAGSVTITTVVDGRRFHGRGRTAKQAKRRLASDVLRTVFNFQFIGQKPDSLSRR